MESHEGRICLHPSPGEVVSQRNSYKKRDGTYVNNHLLTLLTQYDTSCTPREIVHAPKGIQRQEERECRDSEDVEHHPPDHVPFPAEEED